MDTSPSNTNAPDFPLTNLNLVQSEAGRYSQGKKEAVELGTLPHPTPESGTASEILQILAVIPVDFGQRVVSL